MNWKSAQRYIENLSDWFVANLHSYKIANIHQLHILLIALGCLLFIAILPRCLRLVRIYFLAYFTPWGRVTIVRSNVDGDTIKVADRFNTNRSVPIRMIGIDTPESLKSMYMNVAPFGKEAALYTHKRLTKGTRVILIYGKLPYDKFGRELVYIYLPFGEFYNATLVRKGYAFAKEYPPNTKYSKYLNKLSERAKRRKRNMWMVYQEIGILRKDYKHSKQYKKFVAQNPKTDF